MSRPLNSYGGAVNRGRAQKKPIPRAFVSSLPLFVIIEDDKIAEIADYDTFFDECDDDDNPLKDFPSTVYLPWAKFTLTKWGITYVAEGDL